MASKPPLRIRKKRKFKSPNPLFEEWLTEWKESAADKGLKTQYIFGKALSSLKKYPLPLSSGKEAKILEYFGDKICSMLDERLKQCKLEAEHDASQDKVSLQREDSKEDLHRFQDVSPQSSDENQGLQKLTIPCSVLLPPSESVDVVEVEEMSEESKNTFSLLPGTFEVILCVDNCETISGHSAGNKAKLLPELRKCGVPFEIRKLHVGDFLWIARSNGDSAPSFHQNFELVLDFVVERKRLDDLSNSIKDGRFREQKFRLKNCGLRYPIYLVEYHGSHKYLGIPESTLEQAIVNTQVIDGFIVKRTNDVKESVAYLASITKYLQSTLQMHTLMSGSKQVIQYSSSSPKIYLTFDEFNHDAMKTKCLSVREMFAKHLLQFHGLSVDRAAALVDFFQTPSKLLEILGSCASESEQLKLLADVKYGKYQRKICQTLGKLIQQFYTA